MICSLGQNNNIQIIFTLDNSIQKLQTFTFQINYIQNPNSTQPTQPIQVEIYDSLQSKIVINEDKQNLIVITNQASININANASLQSSIKGAGLASTFTISLSLSHEIQKNGGIIIQYPPEVQKDPSQNVTAQVDASQYGYPQTLDQPTIDLSSQQIQFSNDCFKQNINLDENYLQNKIFITIQGLMNPFNGQISNSFQITTFDQSQNVIYLIEQVVSGLTIAGLCSFPCQNCLSSSSTMCTSCFKNSSHPFLQLNTCVSSCSNGRYYDKSLQRCMPCDDNCLTCVNTSKNCLTCGNNQNNLLKINQCVQDCGDGYINDYIDHQCVPCRPGCLTCSKNINNCTSCDLNSATPYYLNFDCLDQCTPDISIQTDSTNICQPCSSNCKTCQQIPNQCLTCQDYMKLDPLHSTCLDVCIPNKQIYNEQNGNCDQCQQNCQTCIGNINTCTSCIDNFVLNSDSTCQKQCVGIINQIPINNVCQVCESPCNTCNNQINQCTSCLFNLLLYDTTCIDNCPDKFEPNNATINQCILVGLICPDGFHVNTAGTGCVPNTFQCDQGYMINDKNTACIPVPGTPVQFPFLLLAICLVIVVFGSFLKDRVQTKVYTSTIFLVSSLEIIQYFCMVVLSGKFGSVSATLLSLIALIMQIASNIFFFNKFRKNQLNDKLFTDWIRIHPKTNKFILFLCLIINFKLVRIVFSGFYGIESTLAQFSHPHQNIHNNLRMVSYFQYLFAYFPIFIADLIIFGQVQWGKSQLLISAIETFILQIFIIFLTYKEFQDIEKMYAPVQVHYSSLKPFNKNQKENLQSKSEIEDGINEKQLIRQDMTTRKVEIELRKKVLTQILKQVGKNFLDSQNNGNDMGVEINEVFTKFNQNKLKLRRAFSMECLRQSQGALMTDGTKAEELYDDENSQSELLNSNDSKYLVLNQKQRYSYPFNKLIDRENVQDLDFVNEVNKIREAFIDDLYKDNCYAESKSQFQRQNTLGHIRKKKLINRRTQTYLRELLQIEGQELLDSDYECNMENEIEIEQDYAQGLINNVIDALSQYSIEKTIILNRRLRHLKSKEVPEFELKDIMGDFDIDDSGNNIQIEGEDGKQVDKQNRIVNKRGYLCDEFGNVINVYGQIVFKFTELDTDEEIPATYVFEKRKENFILMQDNLSQIIVNDYGHGAGKYIQLEGSSKDNNQLIDSDNELVEKELKAFKNGIKQKALFSNSDRDDSKSNYREKSIGEQLFLIEDNDNIEDLIDQITKKINPIKKSKMRNNSASKKQNKSKKKQILGNNNVMPRKTFGNDKELDTNKQIIKQDKKLQKISQLIGGMANQVVDNQGNAISIQEHI